jgi:branched-chain amino acid transport system substrate-binding protein
MSRNKLRVALALLGLVLAGAGIAAEAPVKVGGSIALTGEFEAAGQEHARGLRLWQHDIDERGALLGRPVELVLYDDASRNGTVADLYERLITRDQVDVLVSPYSTPQTLEAAKVAERHGVPMVTVAAAPVVWQQGFRNVFGIYVPANHNMDPVFSEASDHGLKSVALVYEQTDFPEAVAAGAREREAEKGMSVVFDEGYARGTRDLTDLVRRLAATAPDVVIAASYLEECVAFMRAAKAVNLAPRMLAFSGAPSLPAFGETLGPDAQGALSTVQWMRSGLLPGSFDFGFRYQARHGIYPSYDAAGAYAAGQVLEAAVRLAGTVEHDAVRQQLATMRFRSILGHYRVDATGMQVGKQQFMIQWQDGHRSLVYPPDIARWKVKYPFPAWSGR